MKYPRTPHLPGSHATDDDIVLSAYHPSGEVVATEKMDGSNISVNNSGFFVRSGKTAHGQWLSPMWNIFSQISGKLPEHITLFGEFLFWRKSIAYDHLPAPYLIFGATDGTRMLSWAKIQELAETVSIPTVREICRGDAEAVIKLAKQQLDETQEGFVVRPIASFSIDDFASEVRKFVGSWHAPVETNRGRNHVVAESTK